MMSAPQGQATRSFATLPELPIRCSAAVPDTLNTTASKVQPPAKATDRAGRKVDSAGQPAGAGMLSVGSGERDGEGEALGDTDSLVV